MPDSRRLKALPVEAGGFRPLFGLGDYRRIWLAQVVAQLADKFLMFSLIILAYQVSGANTQVAFTLLSYTLPALLVGPVAGLLVDRWNKQKIMLWTNLIRAGLVALIPILPHTALAGQTWPILAITIAFAAVGQLFAPAEAAAIPFVVPKHLLVTANSLFMVTMILTLVVGAPLAQVASRVQLELPYVVATALFLVAALFISGIGSSLAAARASRHEGLVAEFTGGIRAILARPALQLAFVQMTVAIMVMFTLFVLGPGYMSRVLHLAAVDAYAILGPAMVGMIGAAFLVGQYGQHWKRDRILGLALLGAGTILFLMGAVPGFLAQLGLGWSLFWVAVGLSTLFGVAFGFLLIPALTLLMENADEELRGRIFGLFNTVVNGITAIPVLVAGGLADIYGVNRVIGGMGMATFLGGVVSLLIQARLRRSPQK